MTLSLRTAAFADVPRLAELNRAAYPDLVEDGVVFEESQLRAHQDVFPRGQIVAEVVGPHARAEGESSDRITDAKIVGAIATMILPRAIDPLAQHTWMGVTDGGTFARHDACGDTLYLADVYVDASAWGRGVGRALYGALFDLCRGLGLRRIVAGGRLYDYDEHADRMSPHEYVARVLHGELRDRVLLSQVRAGFGVRGLLKSYLHDWRSRHWATLLVWENPSFEARTDAPRSRRAPLASPSERVPSR